MKLFELTDQDLATGLYDPARDEVTARNPTDTRKPVLTLRHINRLKKMRAVERLEKMRRQDLLSVMYGSPDEGGGPMGGSPF